MVGRNVLVVLTGLLTLGASACSGSDSSEADMQIDLADFSIELSTDTLPPGDLTLSAENAGPTTHEFEVFSVPDGVDLDQIEIVDDVADVDAAGLVVIDEIEDIAAGTSAELSLNLEVGSYAIICNVSEHYAQGMHASFTVE
jgi:uncharacterized cupredoxin-like copper-binding protein